jgi:Transposase IS66 family/IS66 C-terminal element
MTRKRAAAQRMRRAARQPGITPLLVPDIRFGARQCSERDLHWCSPTRRRTATRRRELSGVPPAVATGQCRGPGPPLHIKTDSRLCALCRARHKAHARRKFYDIHVVTKSPLADEALRRIAALYEVEDAVRGQSAEQRQLVRQQRSRPLVEAMHDWLRQQLERVSGRSALAKAIRYALNHWNGLIQFLHDGRLELDTNIVERAMRPVALGRKNALFAGSPSGGLHWAIVATLIQSAKLNNVEPLAWLTDVLQRIVSARTKSTELHTLLPWNWKLENTAHVFSSA